jgi:electron transport complex protein RnfG
MNNTKKIIKNTIVISLLGLIFSIFLSLTFNKSYPIIEKNKTDYKKNLLVQILGDTPYDNDLINSFITIEPNRLLNNKKGSNAYIAKNNNQTEAVIIETIAPDGYSGEISILTAISDDEKIISVRIIDHKETPGLGDYIDQNKSLWVNNFIGMNFNAKQDSSWRVKKDQGDFDFKAGATISPRAVINAVKNTLIFYQENKEKFI